MVPLIFTTLNQLSMVNRLVSKEDGKLIVTFDMDLYKRVLKLEYLDSQYKDKWVVCPGFFHKSLCALRCLGKTIEGSGSDEEWVEAEMYSTVTVDEDHMRSHSKCCSTIGLKHFCHSDLLYEHV